MKKIKLLFWPLLILLANGQTVFAESSTGGSCQANGVPMDFNYNCTYSETDGRKQYFFQFQGVATKDANAANPLVVHEVYLQMGTNIAMVPLTGSTNTFYYSDVDNTHSPADYSFIYKYKLSSGSDIQCQTPVFPIAACDKK